MKLVQLWRITKDMNDTAVYINLDNVTYFGPSIDDPKQTIMHLSDGNKVLIKLPAWEVERKLNDIY